MYYDKVYLYIVLSYTGSLPSKIIKRATRKPYAHVSISDDPDLTLMYSFGRRFLYFPWYGGFISEDINDGLFKRMKSSKIAVYRVKVSKDEIKGMKNEINRFSNDDRYFYDYKGAVGMFFKKDMFRDNGYVCSSFVNEVLNNVGLDTHKDGWEILPIDFANLDSAELVYEGLASNYNKQEELSYGFE